MKPRLRSGEIESDLRTHRALAGASRVGLLEALRRADRPMDARELGSMVGLHPNTVRAHMILLEEGGLVGKASEPGSGPGRPRLVFSASPRPAAQPGGLGYPMLLDVLASHLAGGSGYPAPGASDAGRAWGRGISDPPGAPERPARILGTLGTFLDRLGFEPDTQGASAPDAVAGAASRILLHGCPFREAAEAQPGLVCSVHLGLMQGALEAWGTAADVELEPFVTGEACEVSLRPAAREPDEPERPAQPVPAEDTRPLPAFEAPEW